jgi:hypothetical protein
MIKINKIFLIILMWISFSWCGEIEKKWEKKWEKINILKMKKDLLEIKEVFEDEWILFMDNLKNKKVLKKEFIKKF